LQSPWQDKGGVYSDLRGSSLGTGSSNRRRPKSFQSRWGAGLSTVYGGATLLVDYDGNSGGGGVGGGGGCE
jgi:hypothetical protein